MSPFVVCLLGATVWLGALVTWAITLRQRRDLEDLRYGRSGSAFNERDRDRATSRLRDRTPW